MSFLSFQHCDGVWSVECGVWEQLGETVVLVEERAERQSPLLLVSMIPIECIGCLCSAGLWCLQLQQVNDGDDGIMYCIIIIITSSHHHHIATPSCHFEVTPVSLLISPSRLLLSVYSSRQWRRSSTSTRTRWVSGIL